MDWPFGDPLVLLAAVAFDLVAGDPPSRVHPVAGMGWLINSLCKMVSRRGRWRPLLGGAFIMLVGISASIGIGVLVSFFRDRAGWAGLAVEAILLKMTFSVRGLVAAAAKIRRALVAGNLDDARRLLGLHLVSRETSELTEVQVVAATVESVAENASDGIVGPWLFYLVGGLPAALAYRFVNTADAMLGYRDPQREWLGKVPARLDDACNLLPSRLTAVFILLAAPAVGGCWSSAVQVWWRDARKTASPNAGQPMAAAAGALGIELEKVGCYQLGVGNRLPEALDIRRAIWQLLVTAAMALALFNLAGFLRQSA